MTLEAAVREWLAQVADCDLGPNCNCVGHDDLLIMQIEMALEPGAGGDDARG